MSMHENSSDITCARPVSRPAWQLWDVHRWASLAAMYASAAALIVLAIAHWSESDASLTREAAFRAQQREFNESLVLAINNLAEQAGILTSADFCPVRFRMRFPDGGVPAMTATATLARTTADGREQVCQLSTTISGVIDFGLLPPGRYLLQLDWHEMCLEHEFDVLPGVPVDRVVICPPSSNPSQMTVDIDINWPPELSSESLAAVIEVRPGPIEKQDWRWEPAVDWRLQTVAATRIDHDSLRELVRRLQVEGVLPEQVPIAPDAAAVSVPYRYCQIHAITFIYLSHGEQSRDRPQVLGTLLYGTRERDESVPGPGWQATDSPPVYEATPNYFNPWTVDIPQECETQLLQAILDATRSADMTRRSPGTQVRS